MSRADFLKRVMLAVLGMVAWLVVPEQQAQAHMPWTCKKSAGHWTNFGTVYHEARRRRCRKRGGRCYCRYEYYTWSLRTSWVYHYARTRDCTGSGNC